LTSDIIDYDEDFTQPKLILAHKAITIPFTFNSKEAYMDTLLALIRNENAIEKHKEKFYINATFTYKPEEQKEITRRITINLRKTYNL
jgi:hypothetical protein